MLSHLKGLRLLLIRHARCFMLNDNIYLPVSVACRRSLGSSLLALERKSLRLHVLPPSRLLPVCRRAKPSAETHLKDGLTNFWLLIRSWKHGNNNI